MPRALSLAKVSKQLKSKKGALHPRSRKAKILARATLRQEKLTRTKLRNQSKQQHDMMAIEFIHTYIQDPALVDQRTFTRAQERTMLEAFIARDDEELKQLKQRRRPGRPRTKRQDLLQMRRSHEMEVYNGGWKVPDLEDEKNVKMFRNWKGEVGGLVVVKMIELKPE